jgi:hypothetical protein
MYFPKELWFHIRSYVFQLMYPPHIQQKYKDHLKSIVRLPYFLKIQHQKSVIYQYSYLKQHYTHFWEAFQDKDIREYIREEIFYMNQNYDKIYAKNICHGRHSS